MMGIFHVLLGAIIVSSFGKIAHSAETTQKGDRPVQVVISTPLQINHSPGFIILQNRLRTLRLMQDRIVQGNETALDAQRALIMRLEESFATLELDLDNRQERQALAIILLNGANPLRMRGLMNEGPEDILADRFLAAALSYSEGKLGLALTHFAAIEPDSLPLLARAQVALIHGSLLITSDIEKALQLLSEARLLAPGTLIEEAALRRQTQLLSGDPKRLAQLASSYIRRFGRSPFAAAFIAQFAQAITQMPAEFQHEIKDSLDNILATVRGPERQRFFGMIARGALVSGDNELAQFASERALATEENANSAVSRSASLYKAAVGIVSDDFEPSVQALIALQSADLIPEDQEILLAAISIAQELRRWPQNMTPKDAVENMLPASLPEGDYAQFNDARAEQLPSPLMSKAQLLLEASKSLVQNKVDE